jgi:hypothetical protein
VPWTKLLQHRPTFPRGIHQFIVVILDQSPWGRLAVGGHEGHHSKTEAPVKHSIHNTGNDLFKIRNRISNYGAEYRYLLANFRAWQLEQTNGKFSSISSTTPSRNLSSRLAIITTDDPEPASTPRTHSRYYGGFPEVILPCYRCSILLRCRLKSFDHRASFFSHGSLKSENACLHYDNFFSELGLE